MASKHKKKYTIENEEGLFNNWIKPEIGHLPFNKIKPFNLEKIKKNMFDAGRAPRSVQYCFAVFRQIWNHARIDDIVNEDCPTRKVKLPKVENQRVRFLTHDEAKSLLDRLKTKSQQAHDMALFSLHTGCRAGELYSLTWGCIDFENGSVLIRDAKGKPRHVYLTDDVKVMLERLYKEQASNELVFKDRYGKQIKIISKTYERAVNKLKFNDGVDDDRDKVLFHTLRHTFASWHVQNGTDLYTVKELLGHSTIQLTERYSHLKPDGLKQTAKAFNKIIVKNKKKAKKTDEKKVVNIR
jgi:integrase